MFFEQSKSKESRRRRISSRKRTQKSEQFELSRSAVIRRVSKLSSSTFIISQVFFGRHSLVRLFFYLSVHEKFKSAYFSMNTREKFLSVQKKLFFLLSNAKVREIYFLYCYFTLRCFSPTFFVFNSFNFNFPFLCRCVCISTRRGASLDFQRFAS